MGELLGRVMDEEDNDIELGMIGGNGIGDMFDEDSVRSFRVW